MKAPCLDSLARLTQSIAKMLPRLILGFMFVGAISPQPRGAESKSTDEKAAPKVSYYREIRPILQANCQGCHQPAKSKGGYVMTEFKRLVAGGDTAGKAVVPAQPDKIAM